MRIRGEQPVTRLQEPWLRRELDIPREETALWRVYAGDTYNTNHATYIPQLVLISIPTDHRDGPHKNAGVHNVLIVVTRKIQDKYHFVHFSGCYNVTTIHVRQEIVDFECEEVTFCIFIMKLHLDESDQATPRWQI